MINSEHNPQKSFIVVHAGAGYHAVENEEKYLNACRASCIAAMQGLRSGNSAIDAVTKAVTVLEDSPCTNAGVGSNLTLEGSVECDAGVMDGKSLTFGAVGSVSGVKNPVEVAHKLVLMQLNDVLSLGRIPPSVMVGEGACRWACQHGLQCVDQNSMITDSSRKTFNKYKRKLDNANKCFANKKCKTRSHCGDTASSDNLAKKHLEISKDIFCENVNSIASQKPSSLSDNVENNIDPPSIVSSGIKSHRSVNSQDVSLCSPTHLNDTNVQDSDVQDTVVHDSDVQNKNVQDIDLQETVVQDTVGAVCVDQAGNMAAAASSGGIWLKQMGRLGPAAVFGAGCWAHNGMKTKMPGVAVATTGCGEQLMKTLLAKQCGDALQTGDNGSLTFKNVLEGGFLKSEFLHSVQDKNAGMLGLLFEQACASDLSDGCPDSGSVEVLWGHTTSSMCICYMSETHSKPRALVSRLPAESKPGASIAIQGKHFTL